MIYVERAREWLGRAMGPRPVSKNPHNYVISVRLTEDEYRQVSEAAGHADEALSAWARRVLVKAAKRAKR